MSKFQVGQKVKRVRDHSHYTLFRYSKDDAVFTVSAVSDEGIRLKECIARTWYDDGKFELYQEPAQKTFNPKPGDIIVTEGEGNWVCCTVGEVNKLKNISFYTRDPIIGYQRTDSGYIRHQDWDKYGNADGFTEFSIKEIIPASSNNPVTISQQPQDLSFQIKALELENQMLRKLLRREGVEV